MIVRKLSKEEEEVISREIPKCPLCGTELYEWSPDGDGECPVHGHVNWKVFEILEGGKE